MKRRVLSFVLALSLLLSMLLGAPVALAEDPAQDVPAGQVEPAPEESAPAPDPAPADDASGEELPPPRRNSRP